MTIIIEGRAKRPAPAAHREKAVSSDMPVPDIRVNGKTISPTHIFAEMQYHPAATREAAMNEAAEALVVRELLLQRATTQGLEWEVGNPVSEEEAINQLLEREVAVPEADDETCRRWYDANRAKFRTKPLFEASHILYLAPRDDTEARVIARERAKTTLNRLAEHPGDFPAIAQTESRCSTASDGGRLGQIGLGDTSPELDAFFMTLEPGQICPVPIETDYGVHVVQLNQRIEPRELSFDDVKERVLQLLEESVWRTAVRHYLYALSANAKVEGIDFRTSGTPLVQ
jgi:peptidyl-prolyl cis-trans isomerase C